jgi:hypothetical protein
MQADSKPDMLAAALSAYDAGICVIRAHTDGSKRPVGEWAQWQEKRPSREQVAAWFANGHAAMGAVCGSVSGDLEMFELEGRFMRRWGSKEFTERAQQFGAELTIQRLLSGLVVISPSDGRHFIVRTEGPVDGNTKLANDAEGNTLIETRGEGGFVVLPPSHGTTHATGKAWATARGDFASIITLTSDERQRLFALARSYDETPPPAPPKPVSVAQRAKLGRYSGTSGLTSWYDAVVEHLADAWTMRSLLEHYGWTWCYTDKHGRDLMRRPGKDEGVSGSINEAGRLHPFSSSTPFPGARADKGSPTYDLLDVLAVYEHSGVRDDAARTIADTTGIMQAWRRAEDARMRRTFGLPDEEPPTRTAPPNVNAEGEVKQAPPTADIWDERPILAHIRDAARNRMVSPWAVLGCVLARVAAFTPPSTCLPPLIGGTSPLSLFIALHGSSGAGKSAPTQCATDLLPDVPPGCIGPLGLGSGEGLVEAYMELVEETDGGGKTKKVKRQIKHGALFTLDEGQALTEMGSRKGSTILPVLRTAWSGGDPGQANATVETRRSLRPQSYAVGLVSLWQDKAANLLLDDVDGGTPQRFVWLPTGDPGASRNRPTWPGKLDWEPPPAIVMGGIMQTNVLGIDAVIEDDILDARVDAMHGTLAEGPLDAHRRLNKLKVAGVLCVLEGRTTVTADDWHLAERILSLSDDVREWILAEAKRRNADTMAAEVSRVVYREAVVEKSAAERALSRAAKAAWRVVGKADGVAVGRRHITQGISSRDRQHVTVDDAIAEAERLRWITTAADGGYVQGEARPS